MPCVSIAFYDSNDCILSAAIGSNHTRSCRARALYSSSFCLALLPCNRRWFCVDVDVGFAGRGGNRKRANAEKDRTTATKMVSAYVATLEAFRSGNTNSSLFFPLVANLYYMLLYVTMQLCERRVFFSLLLIMSLQ